MRVSSLGYDVGHFTIYYTDLGRGTVPTTVAEPLTVTLEDIPTNHDGSSAFTFRIAFSADVEITPEDMRDHALMLSGGTVTNAARVDDRKDLWELTVDPAGTAAVTILVPLDRACTETGALCTADGVMLTTAPLAAGFVSVPPEHDGETEFLLELSFDAAVVRGSKGHIRALLGVTGGSVTRMRRKDDRLDVAITRATTEVHVFASFDASMIDLTRTSAQAVADLKHYIDFAARGDTKRTRRPSPMLWATMLPIVSDLPVPADLVRHRSSCRAIGGSRSASSAPARR